MRTSSARMADESMTGVLVLEKSDFPMTPDDAVAAAHRSEAAHEDDDETYFFIVQYPESDTHRDVRETPFRQDIGILNDQFGQSAVKGLSHH